MTNKSNRLKALSASDAVLAFGAVLTIPAGLLTALVTSRKGNDNLAVEWVVLFVGIGFLFIGTVVKWWQRRK